MTTKIALNLCMFMIFPTNFQMAYLTVIFLTGRICRVQDEKSVWSIKFHVFSSLSAIERSKWKKCKYFQRVEIIYYFLCQFESVHKNIRNIMSKQTNGRMNERQRGLSILIKIESQIWCHLHAYLTISKGKFPSSDTHTHILRARKANALHSTSLHSIVLSIWN